MNKQIVLSILYLIEINVKYKKDLYKTENIR